MSNTTATRIHVVVPSLSASTAQLDKLVAAAKSAGASCTIVANSRSLAERLAPTRLPFASSGENAGFAASVNFGARQTEWDWLVILNDDVEIDVALFAVALREHLPPANEHLAVVHLDDDHQRAIPGIWATFANVSMMSALLRRFGLLRSQSRNGYYRSFSAVAIRRDAWDAVGGICERYAFTFEDADFARRATSLGFSIDSLRSRPVRHLHSVTTSRWISDVLPVATYSALEYLSCWYGNRRQMRCLLVGALIVRFPFAILRANRRPHVAGILRGIRAIWHDKRPSLPEWERV